MVEPHPAKATTPSTASNTPTPSDQPPAQLKQSSNLQNLRVFLLASLTTSLRKTDRTILRLSTLLSTSTGTDALLCTTSYTLTLVHALLSRLLERRLADIATDIAEKADGILLPGETLIASLPAPTSTKLIAHAVGSSKALGDTIADYRIFVRLWGLIGLYTWARETYLAPVPTRSTKEDKIRRILTWATIVSCVGFQVLENGAYLSSKGALTTASWAGAAGKARESRWWLWSSRFWAVYVGCELARLGVTGYYQDQRTNVVVDDGEKEDKLRREEEILENWLWWKDLMSNIAYAPLTLHWSVEGGLLSDWGVGACGMVAGGALLVDAWRKTR
jgi:hypothetical protein